MGSNWSSRAIKLLQILSFSRSHVTSQQSPFHLSVFSSIIQISLTRKTSVNFTNIFAFSYESDKCSRSIYSVRCLIRSLIIESAAYCNQILLIPLCTYIVHKKVGKLNHSVIVITFKLAQSDPIKRRTLYILTVCIWKK